jgi:hypothetical protein
VNGGISLSKIGGVMHDTCNCANVIARKVRVLRDKSGEDLYGVDEWKQMSRQEHAWCDYFCGNHSRNLHFDAFGRLFEAYIKRNFGAALDAARQKSGGRVRVEASGEALLRTICKLTHIGPKQYAKGTILFSIGCYFIFECVALNSLPPSFFSFQFSLCPSLFYFSSFLQGTDLHLEIF